MYNLFTTAYSLDGCWKNIYKFSNIF